MEHSVGQVAGYAGVTVCALHHYDGIGLLSPGGRSHAGHRRDDDADLDRLQQILFHRELGLPLDEIAVPGPATPQTFVRHPLVGLCYVSGQVVVLVVSCWYEGE